MASVTDSGLENPERSASSDQGRRWERPEWRVSVMWVVNVRKAVVGTGGDWDSPAELVCGFEIGSIAGDEDTIVDRFDGVLGENLLQIGLWWPAKVVFIAKISKSKLFLDLNILL